MPVAKSGTFADLVERYRSQKNNENLENSSSNIPQVKEPPRIVAFAKEESTAVDMEVFVDGVFLCGLEARYTREEYQDLKSCLQQNAETTAGVTWLGKRSPDSGKTAFPQKLGT